jgi:hypothetical protein
MRRKKIYVIWRRRPQMMRTLKANVQWIRILRQSMITNFNDIFFFFSFLFFIRNKPISMKDNDEDLVEVSYLSYGQETDKNWDTYQVFNKTPWKIACNSILLVKASQHFFDETPQRVDSFSIKSSHFMFSISKRKMC